MEQAYRGFRKYLSDNGIVDSRINDLHKGFETLWKAMCDLDLSQLKTFAKAGTLDHWMHAFGDTENGNRNVQAEINRMRNKGEA